MIRSKQLPVDMEDRLARAAESLRSHPQVVFAYLFGGLARGEKWPLSDVDIAVYLSAGSAPEHVKLDILGRLNDILGTDEIDLVVLNQAPPRPDNEHPEKQTGAGGQRPAPETSIRVPGLQKILRLSPGRVGDVRKAGGPCLTLR